jgi:ribose-phosphate pyrophosphokinase
LVVIEKRRLQKPDGSKIEVLNIIGDVRGKNCIIYDDEIDTASTVVQAMDFLKQCGAEDIYTCVTHAILSGPAVQRLVEAPVKEVVATNTVAISPEKNFTKLTRLSVAPLIAEVIRRIHLGISVGELFDE